MIEEEVYIIEAINKYVCVGVECLSMFHNKS